MKTAAAALLLLTLTPAQASHDWFGLDMCEVRKEAMPPELAPSVLPEPGSQGALLSRDYCGQCHNAPGPGMHTTAEWPEVLRRMRLLMEVTARFGGLLQEVRVPTAEEDALISAYLLEHALEPLPVSVADQVPEGYRALCGDCHATPDPAIHGPQKWPAVLARMESYREVMGRPNADISAAARVRAFLTGIETPSNESRGAPATGTASGALDPWLALGPFFALALLGGLRWYAGYRRRT